MTDPNTAPASSGIELTRKGERYAEQSIPAREELARIRREAAAEIDRLIALVDAIDGDPDLEVDQADDEDGGDDEDNGDSEPSLGSLGHTSQVDWMCGGRDDLERDECDHEPSLGWPNPVPGRSRLDGSTFDPSPVDVVDVGMDQTESFLGCDDLEADYCDREDDEREDDHAEKFGIGDEGGLWEQMSAGAYDGSGNALGLRMLRAHRIKPIGPAPLAGTVADRRIW